MKFVLVALVLVTGCGRTISAEWGNNARRCMAISEPAAEQRCLVWADAVRQREITMQRYRRILAAQSLANALGSMQGLAEQNQRSAQMLHDQAEQFPRFQPPEAVPPVGVDHSWGSGSAPPSLPPGYVSSPDPGRPSYFVPPPPGINANQWGAGVAPEPLGGAPEPMN